MAIKRVVDTLDEVPEPLREFYVQEGNRYALDADDAVGLKAALRAQSQAAKEAAERLKQYEGIDPERYRELLEAAERAEADKHKKVGDWEAREQQLIARHKQEMAKQDALLKAMRDSLEEALIGGEAARAIAEAKGEPMLLLPHVQKRARVVEDNGKYVVRVVDPATGAPMIADGSGTPMSISQLVETFRSDDKLGRAFDAPDKSGSGADSGQRRSSGGKRVISREEVPKYLDEVIKGDVVVQ